MNFITYRTPLDLPGMKRLNHVPVILLRILYDLMLVSLLLFAFEREASAYTDPGSGALLWQTLAAAFFGLAFYLRKLKRWLGSKKPEKKE